VVPSPESAIEVLVKFSLRNFLAHHVVNVDFVRRQVAETLEEALTSDQED